MERWARRQQDEIGADPALRWYGVGLSLAELLTACWLYSIDAASFLGKGSEAICWPFLPACHVWRVLPAGGVNAVLVLLGALALGAAVLFARRPVPGWWLLLGAEALKLLVVAQDFRLRANQHYMLFFAVATFLWLPDKRRAVRYVVVLFYFWAGLLKLNTEWLSGAALYAPVWFFTGRLLPVACAYVVCLELVVVWGLLSPRRLVFWGALGQFALFHVFSWPVVGAFYPLLMAAILAIFPLCRLLPQEDARRTDWTTWGLVAGFSAMQLLPLVFPGDTAITGEGRLFSLHMFDAKIQCHARARVHDAAGAVLNDINLTMAMSPRIACDPIVYYDRAQTLCRQLTPVGQDLDLSLDSRRTTEPDFRPVVRVDRFCARRLTYDWWRRNAWILE